MRICFECRTNKDYVMINTLTVMTPDRTRITFDRRETDYDISEDGILDMEWVGVYIWAINDCNIFGDVGCFPDEGERTMEEIIHLLKGGVATFDLEDDADEDYSVEIISWHIS